MLRVKTGSQKQALIDRAGILRLEDLIASAQPHSYQQTATPQQQRARSRKTPSGVDWHAFSRF
jgi:hypothetical protein